MESHYLYDSNETVLSYEVQNAAGDTDCLYLPTDIVSVAKLKERLGVDSFSECRVTESYNIRLPQNVYELVKKIDSIEELTAVNELCERTVRFDDAKMSQFELITEFAKASSIKELTALARSIHDFEVTTGVSNLKEYGSFVINESGLFEVDELIRPYIDYEAFAQGKIESMFQSSGFVDGGFVASAHSLESILAYNGEFADPLEMSEEGLQTLRLYNTLSGRIYKKDFYGDLSEDDMALSAGELVQYQEQICEKVRNDTCAGEEARGLMHYFDEDRTVAGKVLVARPTVEEYQGELYGVLECRIKEPLTPEELNQLMSYWNGQESDGWGEGFEQREINVEAGDLYVSFWNCKESIMTEEQLKGYVEQETGLVSGSMQMQ